MAGKKYQPTLSLDLDGHNVSHLILANVHGNVYVILRKDIYV